jgi:hypothetical protein
LTNSFGELSPNAKLIHVAALIAMAVAMILLMAPAAFHRVATDGEPSGHVLRWGTWALLTALAIISLGLSGELYVTLTLAFHGQAVASISALAAEIVMLTLWFAWPLIRRRAPS